MANTTKRTDWRDKLLESIFADARISLNDTLLETCADQEYRICLLELGIN